jgi:hypothetical protein
MMQRMARTYGPREDVDMSPKKSYSTAADLGTLPFRALIKLLDAK